MKQKDQKTSCARKTSIGGQALIEGIMMRGPKMTAMAVRNTKGEMVIEEFPTESRKRPAFCRWPLIRGILGYIDSMTLGYKCLMRSAEIAGLEDVVEEKPAKKKKKNKDEPSVVAPEEPVAAETEATPAPEGEQARSEEEDKLPAWVMTLTMVLSVVLGFGLAILLFVWGPSALFTLLNRWIPWLHGHGTAVDSLIKSAFEGVLKIALLVGYMGAISLMKDIRRTFMFHGGEHKTIFCYEAGLELTVENVKKMRRFHPRCGTSFLILMLLVSIFISFFIDPISVLISGHTLPLLWRTLIKLLLLPLIVGIGYELIKFAGRHDNLLTRIISAPGVWLQHMTVLEPTDDMIECAIEAVKRVIPEDGSDRW